MNQVAKTRHPRSRLTRREVADRLGVSVATVRRMERRALHPMQDESGVWLFAVEEVERVAIERGGKPRRGRVDEGEIAARVFEMFEDGKDLQEIVTTLRQPPWLVRELYAEWEVDLMSGQFERQQQKENREHDKWARSMRRRG